MAYELGAIDDLQVQIANAVVAAHDVEVHVADDVLELVAEELEIVVAGCCFADADERVAPAAAIGEAEADFDFVRDFVAVGARRGRGARSRRPERACGCARPVALVGKPTTSSWTRRGHGVSLRAMRLSQKPKTSRESNREDDNRSDQQRDCGTDGTKERAAVE